MNVIVTLFGVVGWAGFTALMHSTVPVPPLAVNEAMSHVQLRPPGNGEARHPPSCKLAVAVLISTVPQATLTKHPGGGNLILMTSESS